MTKDEFLKKSAFLQGYISQLLEDYNVELGNYDTYNSYYVDALLSGKRGAADAFFKMMNRHDENVQQIRTQLNKSVDELIEICDNFGIDEVLELCDGSSADEVLEICDNFGIDPSVFLSDAIF